MHDKLQVPALQIEVPLDEPGHTVQLAPHEAGLDDRAQFPLHRLKPSLHIAAQTNVSALAWQLAVPLVNPSHGLHRSPQLVTALLRTHPDEHRWYPAAHSHWLLLRLQLALSPQSPGSSQPDKQRPILRLQYAPCPQSAGAAHGITWQLPLEHSC